MIKMKVKSAIRLDMSFTPQIVARGAAAIGKDIRKDFQKTVETWDKKPDFKITTTTSGSRVKMRIYTDDQIWNWLDCGVEPHRIEPVHAEALVFSSGYKAKTRPDSLSSREGGEFGRTVYSQGVDHPGIEPRNWTCRISEKWHCKLRNNLRCVIKDALLIKCR